MTKKQKAVVEKYLGLFAELEGGYDNEVIHVRADDLLLQVLEELGFAEISKAYEKVSEIGFWYA